MSKHHSKQFLVTVGLISTLGLISPTHGEDRTIEIVRNDGRSFRAIPKSLTATAIVVVRESDKKEFSLAISTLTPDTLERSKMAIKTQNEQETLDRRAELEATRKKLTAYSHRCDFGILTLYCSEAECAIDKNGYNSGVTLKAPDRSNFHCHSLARYNITTKAQLREHVSDTIEERMKGKTQPERDKLLKDIYIREVKVGEWSGYEVLPSDSLETIRSLFLERDGSFFAFSHYGPESGATYRKKPSEISKLKIDQTEFERIIIHLKIE